MKTLKFLAICVSIAAPCWGADSGGVADESLRSGAPKTLDGVAIEAVERYPSTRSHELNVGFAYYPFKPYYNGFTLEGGYTQYFSKTFAWELIHAGYAFTVDTSLSSQLAENFQLAPDRIERLRAVFSTNAMYTHSHGKILLFDKFIRYFRSNLLGGLGMVMTNQRSEIAASLGIRIDAHVTDTFSWKFEFRDLIALNGFENFSSFSLGTSVSF